MKISRPIVLGLVILAVGAGGYYWYNTRVNCCEPPIEVIQARDEAERVKEAWSGHWDYFTSDDQGYSQGVNLRLFAEDGGISGTFDAVWSFPGAPAARLNDGTLISNSVEGNRIVGTWEGSREDKGRVVLTLSDDKQQLTWEGLLAEGSADDGFALNGKRIFYRNQWVAWTPTEQAEFLQTIKNLLQEKKSNYTIQPGEDATIMVTDNYAVINAFVPNSPDEEGGWLYLKKDNGKWAIILGPKVRFSKNELDQAGIPVVMRY